MIILLFPAALLAVFGYLIKYRKAASLISGYNTASREKKQEYDTEKLCTYTGNLVFILSAIMLIMAVLTLFFGAHAETIIRLGLIAFLATVAAGLLYLNTGGRVKK